MTLRALITVLVLGLAGSTLGLAACGEEDRPASGSGEAEVRREGSLVRKRDNARTTIRVGSKNFTEQRVLGEIYAQGLEAVGFKVSRELDLGDERQAQAALERGVIDGYPEYTGTALSSLCGVPAAEVPKDPARAFERARRCFARRELTALPPTPFTSSNEVAVTRAVSAARDLQQISDLKAVDQDFTLYGAPECRRRSDCLAGLQDVYGLRFKRFAPVAVDRRHEVLEGGDAVASIVFTTDPQNKRSELVLLADDLGMFPPNNSTFVIREQVVAEAGPDLVRTVERVQTGLTDEVMQELNARVDLDGEKPADVARSFLQAAGLVGTG